MTTDSLYQIFLKNPVISTDTRKIEKNSLFFALKGDKFNANEFAENAIALGAAYAIVDEAQYAKNDRFILVDDVLSSLQQLAAYHRKQLKIPVIGLTGSNGKTTTKELINAVLSKKFITYATKGNLNNHIGVPLTLLSITPDIEIAIIEMGANHQKEIAFLCTLCQPNIGLITNIGKAHLEGFGGIEGVKKGKGELYDWLKNTNGTAFINHDSASLREMASTKQLEDIIWYGDAENAFVSGKCLSNEPFLKISWKTNQAKADEQIIQTNLTGSYNFENILAAISLGLHFGLKADEIKTGIEQYEPNNNRSQVLKTEKNTIICDFYNANPSSMSAAIINLFNQQTDKKVIILGDMFELGEESEAEHQEIARQVLAHNAYLSIFIGESFFKNHSGENIKYYKTTLEAINYLKENQLFNALILVKGSRGMKMEQLLEVL